MWRRSMDINKPNGIKTDVVLEQSTENHMWTNT